MSRVATEPPVLVPPPPTSTTAGWSRRCTRPTGAIPTPKPRYHLVVIGAGTAGLVSAAAAAGLGATRRAGRAASDGRRLPERGMRAVQGRDPRRARLARRREPRARRSAGPATSGEGRLRRGDGTDAPDPRRHQPDRRRAAAIATSGSTSFSATADSSSQDAVEVDGAAPPVPPCHHRDRRARRRRRRFPGWRRRAITPTRRSSRSRAAAAAGGDRRRAPIGCEMAQAFARLGAEVTVLDAGAAHPAARGRRRGRDRRAGDGARRGALPPRARR